MQIQEIFHTFRERIVEMELFRDVVNETAEKEFARFANFAQADASDGKDGLRHYESRQSMGFYDPESGAYSRYGHTTSRAEDRMLLIVKQKNRQYGWLLVEAYEEFEDFLERTYAWLGKHDWEAWRLGEFGNIRRSDLSEKPFTWYLDTVKRKFSHDPKDILHRLRDIYPRLAATEVRNKSGRNLRVSVELIANLRHKIVHARGNVSDKDEFVERVLTKSGVWNEGKPKTEDRGLVETYLSTNPDDCFIKLIEVSAPLPDGASLEAQRILNPYFDICGSLISDLVADAVLIQRAVSAQQETTIR